MYTGQVILNQNEFASFYYLTKNFGVKRLKNAVEQHISKNRSESYKTRNSSKKKNQINRKMLSTNKSSKDNSYTKSTNSKITDTLPTSEFINMQSSVTIPEINNPYNKFSNYCNKEYIHKNKVLPPLIASINQFSNENKNYGGNRNVKVTNSQKNKSSRKNTLSNSLNNTSFNSKRINSYRCKGG
ncbi:Hypothetical protein SRAE_2000117600 [Strongyloides ratti]|uniref:Uncharacterized protein n=1 Tax=Strongyloides ratti TaxID=34506 RepID=A0A090LED5_STRRB|nr:Hypothetical protein SRAE_2000117600 [Strongyloides ratti]CEF66508.1 Hypothetical protein SRAE_2000117600 [Strongyloides ratti]